jgi:hypothetical protein
MVTALFHPAPYAHYWVCAWISLLICWRGFDQVGLEHHPTLTHWDNNQFHGISPNAKVSGLPWRDHWIVRPEHRWR